MRILVASLRSPVPVVDGASLRLHNLLSVLRARHQLHLVCCGNSVEIDGIESTVLPPLPRASLTTRVARAGRSLWSEPATIQEVRAMSLLDTVAKARRTSRFDVAHVSGAPGAVLGEALEGLPCVLDAIDAWHLNRREEIRADTFPRAAAGRATSIAIKRFERRALARFDVTTVTSTDDRRALLSLAPQAWVEVIPNGVDLDYFAPQNEVASDPTLVAFHGNFGYAPNVDAAGFLAREVLPRVKVHIPEARLRLIGRNVPERLLALGAPDVELTGEVPDVRPLLTEAGVVACAVRAGTGIKNKLLEAAALALPIVATPAAVGDIGLVDEQHLLVAEGADDIAGAIIRLMSDSELRARLGVAARSALLAGWTWHRAAHRFEELYEEIRG
jgi:glycosyltransferase involved in cell wall biosynthesis